MPPPPKPSLFKRIANIAGLLVVAFVGYKLLAPRLNWVPLEEFWAGSEPRLELLSLSCELTEPVAMPMPVGVAGAVNRPRGGRLAVTGMIRNVSGAPIQTLDVTVNLGPGSAGLQARVDLSPIPDRHAGSFSGENLDLSGDVRNEDPCYVSRIEDEKGRRLAFVDKRR